MIAAGGTAGHVVPALAVADALRARGAAVEWVGGERAEAELVPGAGYPFHALRVAGLDRRNPLRAARAAGLAAAAIVAARRLLRRRGMDVVLGGGGYVAGPVGLAAATLGLPLFLTEADSHLGVSNRLLAPLARRLFLAFPIEGRDEPRHVVTGRPVPADTGALDPAAARGSLGLPADCPCLLVFGGSLGARSLNRAALAAFGPSAPCTVLHVSGRRDYEELRAHLDPPPAHYHLVPYVEPFAAALAASDLAVARSGGSVWELAAAGLPALLVPYPHATADHQTGNAAFMARAGAAVVLADAEVDGPRLAHAVGELLADRTRLAAMAAAARDIARRDAAERIAAEVLAG
jgi:UDP-N-acetylglucosamine--N-acetylmuramyl-(pentapeptide) pyrophosphoryl-undecaprenol N-acetylglucosamine transferase